MPDHYFFDTLNVLYAGDLRRAGHEARVFEHNLYGADDPEASLGRLRAHLDELGAEVLLFDRLHDAEILGILRSDAVIGVGVLHQRSAVRLPGVDFALPWMDREPVVGAVDALAAQGLAGAGDVPGVTVAAGERPFAHKPSVVRLFDESVLAYDLLETVRPSPAPGPLRKHVFGNLGCPYRNAPNRTGFLEGIELPEDVTARGCTFCERPDYDRIRPPVALRLIDGQLGQVRDAWPGLEQLIVVDEYALRYVDDLADLLIDRGLTDVEVFLSARVDWVLKFEARLEQALVRIDGRFGLVMYLVGAESFSPFELWRFNKGVTVQTMARSFEVLERLRARYEAFRCEPSFGFILFTPWTTPLDLYLNRLYLERLGFERFREAAALTRLRLYPDHALYWRAKEDGLLLDEGGGGADASDRYGYEAEVPWRFARPETQAIYERVFAQPSGQAGLKELGRALQPHLEAIRARLAGLNLDDLDVIRRVALGD